MIYGAELYEPFYFYFDQHTRYVTNFGVVSQIIQSSTVRPNARFRGEDVENCTIRGDGTIHHFGINIPNK